ncbi:MAG: 1-deoxy-D-xylulose-5-phosphate reductoisomerase [Thermodesulfobacteriota bacterium]
MALVKNLSILGSTGSIGQSTLELVKRHPDRFKIVGLAAGRNIKLLMEQIEEFKPRVVSVLNEDDRRVLKREIPGDIECLHGVEGARNVAVIDEANIVVSAFVGAPGLTPTLSAIKAGKDVALANKEVLVMAGRIVMEEVKKNGVRILPVDSEHSAIFQSIEGHRREDIRKVILTASGGPFLYIPHEKVRDVTPEEAMAHPNWKMGKKISIDSATLMNKGLEVIEARWLFDIQPYRIAVYIHPQSIVHSMVEYIDGSMMAQMGTADMKGPIAYALSYPERMDSGIIPLDLCGIGRLEFMEPDIDRFPCLRLAFDALKEGGTMTTVMNAVDEVAVEAFLRREISLTDIPVVIDAVMQIHDIRKDSSLEDILDADRWARDTAFEMIKSRHRVL